MTKTNGALETLELMRRLYGDINFDGLEPNARTYIEAGLRYAEYAARSNAMRWLEKCESPIERIFMAALWALHVPTGIEGWQPQVEVGPYRVDFVYTYNIEGIGVPVKVAVELDGHEFHEKTKAQAKRDKAKDRYLQKQGYYVFRYTGSDVFADPERCIQEIHDFASDKYSEMNAFEDIEHTVAIINNIKKASNAGVYMFKRDRRSTAGRPEDDQTETKERPKVVDPSTSAKEECDRDGVA